LALALAPAGAQAATALPADVHFAGQLLDGTKVVLPDAAAGKPCIVVVGMSRGSADPTERWSTELAKREGDHAAVFSIALLDKVPGLFRGMVVRSLRKQYDLPDGKAPTYFLTSFDGTTLRQVAPTGKDDDPATYVFDAHGKLLASFRETYSEDALARVLKAVPDQP
jgi:hypothetical protein